MFDAYRPDERVHLKPYRLPITFLCAFTFFQAPQLAATLFSENYQWYIAAQVALRFLALYIGAKYGWPFESEREQAARLQHQPRH